MSEANFQSKLIEDIKLRLPGCVVMKNNAKYKQGIPDVLVLFGNKYALLECKRSKNAPHRPNQDWYVEHVRNMGGFACFIYPENKETMLDELEYTLRFGG